MKNIIETTQIECDKSNFLIDLIEYDNESLYVEIVQCVFNSNEINKKIKINLTVLSDIIKILQNYHAKTQLNPDLKNKHITDAEQKIIQNRYLKGVSIKDLAMQFDQTNELIEIVLRNKGIEIVENKVPKPKYWRDNKRRKKYN